jgi:predicted permease
MGASRVGTTGFTTGGTVVSFQIALSVVLLTGMGLLSRSLEHILSVDPGFDKHHVLLFSLNAKQAGYQNKQLGRIYWQIRKGIETMQGVHSASFSLGAPLSRSWGENITIPGYEPVSTNDDVVYREIESPDYFRAMGIPLILGRDFTAGDDPVHFKVAVLNQSAARMYFDERNPIGSRIGLGPDSKTDIQIVGVVGDTKHNGLREPTPRVVYTPFLQSPDIVSEVTFEVRTVSDPLGLINTVRADISKVDPALSPYDFRTLSSVVADLLVRERSVVIFAGLFSLCGLVLSYLSLYGLTAYVTSRKAHEFAIRIALGAQRHILLRMVMRQTFVLVLVGVGAGLAIASILAKFLSGMLFGVRYSDPLTFAIASFLSFAVAMLASYFPARRCVKVDPMFILRNE